MAKDPFETALAGFREWAGTPGRRLLGTAEADISELDVLFRYMPDQLGISAPDELRPGHIGELLLEVFPRKVLVGGPEDLAATVTALRDFLGYLGDARQLAPQTIRELEQELDEVEPEFAGAVLDPANWGPGRMIAAEMQADGVDLNDPAAVARWIEGYNDRLGLDAVNGDVPEIDFKREFGLPDVLPPMRLPDETDLADMARAAPMIGQLAALVEWVGEDGVSVDSEGQLSGADEAAAAAALGVSAGELRYLWEYAYAADWIDDDNDEMRMLPASTAEDWADGDDEDVLDAWDATCEAVIAQALNLAADEDPELAGDLDFEQQGAGLCVLLFLAKREGITDAEVSELVREAAGADSSPAEWDAWVRAHGDPARLLLDQMARLGVIRLPDPSSHDAVIRLSPLGLWTMRRQIESFDVQVPLLPPPEEMSAVDLLSLAAGASEDEFEAESDAWLATREPEQAAREMLTLAAAGEPSDRVLAVAVVTKIGAPAEPVWREVLDAQELRPYAKATLTSLGGGTPGESDLPGLELSADEMAWMTTDLLAIMCGEEDEEMPGEMAEQLADMIPAGQEAMVFDLISRGSHPDAVEVLTMIGRHHPDKGIAKQARKFAYKAGSRRAGDG
jgi:hypothetical protein